MGLDFGFERLPRKEYESLKSKDEFYEMDKQELIHPELVINWCGRGNAAEGWFRNAFHYYDDYDGILFRPIAISDLGAAISEILDHIHQYNFQMPKIEAGYYIDEVDGEYKNVKIDGIEVSISGKDGMFSRIQRNDDCRLLMSANYYIDDWDLSMAYAVLEKISEILKTFDWDNDVLLYYVSY